MLFNQGDANASPNNQPTAILTTQGTFPPIPDETAALIPGYATTAPPVFFGHYFKPENCPLEPELDNLSCLDFSVAKGGPMVAYRWDGEAKLTPNKYLAV